MTFPFGSDIMKSRYYQTVVLNKKERTILGKELKEARLKTGLTQAEVAKKVKISTMSYQRYEYGERVPDAYMVQRLAKVLNTTVPKLFTLADD